VHGEILTGGLNGARSFGGHSWHKKRAEPVALSSSGPADDQLALLAAWLGFVLPALRARRSCDSTISGDRVQGLAHEKSRNLQKVQFSTFPQSLPSVWTRC
jgi:hypothetical protein